MPVIAFFLVYFALSSLGLPGLNGFVGEFLVLLGTGVSSQPNAGMPAVLGLPYVIPAALGIVLSAVYLLYLVGRLMFGPLIEPGHSQTPGHGDAGTAAPGHGEVVTADSFSSTSNAIQTKPGELPPDASPREWAILAPLAALILLLGVWPAPMTRSIDRAVEPLLKRIERANSTTPPATTQVTTDYTERNARL